MAIGTHQYSGGHKTTTRWTTGQASHGFHTRPPPLRDAMPMWNLLSALAPPIYNLLMLFRLVLWAMLGRNVLASRECSAS